MNFDLDQWIDEVTKESLAGLGERDRAELRALLRLPSFRKVGGLLFQELNGHVHSLTMIDPQEAVAIAAIQGKIAGIRSLFNTLFDEASEKDDHGNSDTHSPAEL